MLQFCITAQLLMTAGRVMGWRSYALLGGQLLLAAAAAAGTD